MTDKKVAAVIAAISRGPYSIDASIHNGVAQVRGPDGYFKDAHGHLILFVRIDAEKLVRLYNEDAALK